MGDARRVAVITGGASGIGLEIVRHFALQDFAVVAVDWSIEACAEAERTLEGLVSHVRIVTGDVGTPKGAQTGVDAAIESFGRLDVLCNNAAVHYSERIENHALRTWRETFRVNVEAAMLCSQLALPHMKRQGGGSIINMGSISGLVPYAGGAAYAASKAAVVAMTKALAVEVGPYGVRVNCICAGSIQHRVADAGEGSASTRIPIGRRGTPSDVAHLVSYLASEHASYMTGSTIVLDGGLIAGRERQR